MSGTIATYTFGNLILDRQRARLLRDGQEIKLRPKSFELLAYLIENQGRLVTKDELMKAVWPDSFVTDDSLVQCVRDIRRAFGDDSQQHIKTVPRRGYIFETDVIQNGAGTIAEEPPAATVPASTAVVAGDAERPPARRLWPWIGPAVLTLAAISVALALYPSTNTPPPVWRPVPLTSYPGIELNPAVSPDNNSVAFAWNGEAQDNFDIYVQPAGQRLPRRLTTDPAQDTSPAWSPDGARIAFLRRVDGERRQLILIPALGGAEEILAETRTLLVGGDFDSDLKRNVSWAPGGQWIVVRHRETKESLEGLFLVSVSTGEKRPMIETPAGYRDLNPAFSPNGDAIAFARRRGAASGLYIVPLSKDLSPSGQARPLTNGHGLMHPVWSTDGRRILYTSESGALFVINARGSDKPQSIQSESANIRELSLARDLVYSQFVFDPNVWRAEIPPPDSSPTAPHVLISSTRWDNSAQYSPDGKTIAFLSSRSGHEEIWTSNADGSNQNPVQLTSFGPAAGIRFPTWSHDGRRIVFHARPEGQSDLFSVAETGGPPKRLTSDPFDDILGRYSQDGKWIYFSSNRSGRSEVWKIPADGGEATRLTTGGGVMPVESPDGKSVFFERPPGTENGIWKIPAEGGEEKRVTGPIAKEVAFAVSREGIYYAAPRESPTRQLIYFLNFSTGQTRPVVVSDREIGIGMSLSVDGRFLIFPQRDQVGSDLMLIRDFGLRMP